MLTSVSLRSPASTSNIPNMFLTSPKLVNITLLRCIFPVVLPWEQVRRFRTARSTVTECLKVIRQSPNLQECRFEYVYSPDSLISKTIMPHLQLKHLHVGLKDSETSISSITSLVLRSACNLERFTIGIRFDYADLIPCLESIPSLTFLHLEMLIGPDGGLTRHFVALLDPLSNSNFRISSISSIEVRYIATVVLLSTCWFIDGIYPMMSKLLRISPLESLNCNRLKFFLQFRIKSLLMCKKN